VVTGIRAWWSWSGLEADLITQFVEWMESHHCHGSLFQTRSTETNPSHSKIGDPRVPTSPSISPCPLCGRFCRSTLVPMGPPKSYILSLCFSEKGLWPMEPHHRPSCVNLIKLHVSNTVWPQRLLVATSVMWR
jgi:hypothetical protein